MPVTPHRLLKCLLPVFLLAVSWTSAAQAQTIRGRVVDAETGAGLREVGIMAFMDGDSITATITRSNGDFSLRVPRAGRVKLAATRQGYLPAGVDSVQAYPEGITTIEDIQLEVSPIVLDEVTVEARQSRLTPGREWIRRNQLLGRGTFFSGAVLRQINPSSLSEHIAERTDFWVRYSERGVPSLVKRPIGCVDVYMNRWPINRVFEGDVVGWLSMEEIPLEAIAAIEVYDDSRDLPPGYWFTDRGDHQVCALVNIWTWDSYH